MLAQADFQWSRSALELLEFVAAFIATGAVGFRYTALRGRLGTPAPAADATPVFTDAARLAAVLGLAGMLVGVGRTAFNLPAIAARQHATVGHVLFGGLPALGIWLAVLALVGFALAAARVPGGWPLAALGVVLGPLSALFSGQWARLVNPLHMLFGGLWIGTLFVLVVAGLSMLLRDEPARARRGAIAADMVNAFSPLALVSGGLLVLTGVTTAWRHLGSLPALWSTPYGVALLIKLALVAGVFTLGAWNWRRQRPALGTESAAHAIRRSSRAELTLAALVLLVTSVLVTLPAPAEENEHHGGAEHAPAAAAEAPPLPAPAPTR